MHICDIHTPNGSLNYRNMACQYFQCLDAEWGTTKWRNTSTMHLGALPLPRTNNDICVLYILDVHFASNQYFMDTIENRVIFFL